VLKTGPEVSDVDNGSSLLFASNEQLALLQTTTEVYFDATFKVVPTIHYLLITIFFPFADAAFLPCLSSCPARRVLCILQCS